MNYTYILRCSDGSLYTGWTNNIEKRVAEHKSGRGARYTKGRLPVELAYYEVFDTKNEAMKRECEIKKLPRGQKLKMLKSFKCPLCADKNYTQVFAEKNFDKAKCTKM